MAIRLRARMLTVGELAAPLSGLLGIGTGWAHRDLRSREMTIDDKRKLRADPRGGFLCRRPRGAFIAGQAAVLLIGVVMSSGAAASVCSVRALNSFHVSGLTITSAATMVAKDGVKKYCGIQGILTTSGGGVGKGRAGLQMYLPEHWNGKFLFEGGGGFDGTLPAVGMAAVPLTKGYAIVATDSGHIADPLFSPPSNDASWSLVTKGVPDRIKLADYFYRSRHQVVIAAKTVVQSYYGKDIRYAYMSGCSNGGHEAVEHAMDFPGDFDGIIAGDAWIDQPGNELWNLRNVRALVRAWIPPSALPALQAAVFAQCDAVDGVKDNLIQNPAKCAFDPDTLVPAVLTRRQANALKVRMAAIRDQEGNLVFPGASVAGIGDNELTWTGLGADEFAYLDPPGTAFPPEYPTGAQPWGAPALSSANWQLAFGLLGYMGYKDPSVDLLGNLVFDSRGQLKDAARDVAYAAGRAGLASDPKALNAFIRKGGRLLMYDGYADPVLNPYEKVLFYERLAGMNGGYARLQKNVRLFMFPDMQHCSLGTGPNSADTLTALEDWVEKGAAPTALLATHSTQGAVDRTMPVCMFPREAKYKGSGNVDDARNWSCPANSRLLEVGPNGAAAGLGEAPAAR